MPSHIDVGAWPTFMFTACAYEDYAMRSVNSPVWRPMLLPRDWKHETRMWLKEKETAFLTRLPKQTAKDSGSDSEWEKE